MGLLEKFDTVRVENDNRISAEERRYCEAVQKSYEESGRFLIKLRDMLKQQEETQDSILSIIADRYSRPNFASIKTDRSDIDTAIENRHSDFIRHLFHYFARNHDVTINSNPAINNLVPKKPPVPDYYLWRVEKNNSEKMEEYEESVNKYKEEIENLSLNYTQVLDEVFAQLGGFSFEEKAITELKEKCRANVRPYKSWGGLSTQYDVCGDTIKLQYGCSQSSYSEDFSLTDSAKAVLRCVSFFENGTTHYIVKELNDIISNYRIENNIFEFSNLEKLRRIKLYKNRRVDFKFVSAEIAQQFVKEFMEEQ